MKSLSLLLLMFFAQNVLANEVKVVDVKYVQTGEHRYRFDVSLLHGDTGWDHYADAWEVLNEQKQVIGTRTLYHPHENEQPFTRSLSGVRIPAGLKTVYVRGHDKVHGYGKLFKVNIK